jgi:DNA processing protein
MNKLREAIAFVEACNSLRINNGDRAGLIREAGSLGQVLSCLERCPDRHPGLLSRLKEESERRCSHAYPAHWQAIVLDEPAYPKRLYHMSMPPTVLFVSGRDPTLADSAFVVAVIGSRKPSVYGVEVTKRLTADLAGREIPVVSGGARGIDALAHRTAISCGAPTLAVLGNGLGVTYPPEHRSLYKKITECGLLLTEFPPGMAPRRSHFPARNRIIAGLADAVLVTEASGSSGTLITAGFAGDYGRDVLAVPGSILSGSSRSCHRLIRDGAILVETIDDIPGIPAASGGSVDDLKEKPAGATGLERQDQLVLELLAASPRTLADLVETSGLKRDRLIYRLALLTERNLIRVDRGLYTLTRLA